MRNPKSLKMENSILCPNKIGNQSIQQLKFLKESNCELSIENNSLSEKLCLISTTILSLTVLFQDILANYDFKVP